MISDSILKTGIISWLSEIAVFVGRMRRVIRKAIYKAIQIVFRRIGL